MSRIVEFFSAIEPYFFQCILGAAAFFSLWKDWNEYGSKAGRYQRPVQFCLLGLVVGAFVLSLFETYKTHGEARSAHQHEQESQNKIDGLTDQVRQERQENKETRDDFRQSFDALYQKYSDLASKTQNAELLREIQQTRGELKTTQEKLNQPKARLSSGFWTGEADDSLPSEITVMRQRDGSVAFDISLANQTDVNALKGAAVVRICTACKYAKEPEGFHPIAGAADSDREVTFEHIFAHTKLQKYRIEVAVPPSAKRFQVDIHSACENCVPQLQKLFASIQ
jgi:hypothetical protein